MESSAAAMAAGLGERDDATEEERRREPAWLRSLLGARFFAACTSHRGMSRSECNQYCLTCADAAAGAVGCQWCVAAAHGCAGWEDHRVVQVRRSSYHNVVRVSELERALDLSRVQTYVINRDRVVFLNERPQAPRNGRCAAAAAVACAACEACGRGLLDVAFRFCSLGCKVRELLSFSGSLRSATIFAIFGPRPRRRLKCMESDPTLTFTIDPNNIPEPQISGPQEDEEDDDEEEDEPFYPTKTNAVQSKASGGCRPPAPAQGQPSASSSRPRRGGRRVTRRDQNGNDGDKEGDQEAAAAILAFAAATARSVPAASAADPNSYRRRARKGAHRAPERAPFV
uniref:PLATZ transcription factor family protein n=1 Tax=Oryza punctata TaxID=4537 RepID=A0A0E0JWQ3_ORYPU